jgi:hypothetical protein
MRILLALLILALPVLARDPDKLLKEAKALDVKAEALLDQGRRAEAFELLAKAADLRAQARQATRAEAPGETAKPKKKAKKNKPEGKAKKAPDPREALDAAFEQLDRALEKGDLEAARGAAHQVRRHLLRWTKQLDAREKRLAAQGSGSVEARIAALERQVKELRKLLDRSPG